MLQDLSTLIMHLIPRETPLLIHSSSLAKPGHWVLSESGLLDATLPCCDMPDPRRVILLHSGSLESQSLFLEYPYVTRHSPIRTPVGSPDEQSCSTGVVFAWGAPDWSSKVQSYGLLLQFWLPLSGAIVGWVLLFKLSSILRLFMSTLVFCHYPPMLYYSRLFMLHYGRLFGKRQDGNYSSFMHQWHVSFFVSCCLSSLHVIVNQQS